MDNEFVFKVVATYIDEYNGDKETTGTFFVMASTYTEAVEKVEDYFIMDNIIEINDVYAYEASILEVSKETGEIIDYELRQKEE